MKRALRPWAIWRRIYYGTGFFTILGMLGVLVYFITFYQPANCFDTVMNGDETGVDCGGSCVRICASDVLPPRVVWAKSFKITDGQYNAVAYVENQNQTAATPELEYRFEFLNNGQVVAEKTGTTVLPPNSVYPIFEGRVFTVGEQPITETRLTLTPATMWLPAGVGRDQFRSLDKELTGADSRPRLDVELENTALTPAEDLEIVATILNDAGEPVTASQFYLERIEARSTENLVFTWPEPIAKTVRSCIIPTDVALGIDLSGSMNNDGDTPPQPVTDALQAASQFASQLQEKDQVALVTFASDAELASLLSSGFDTVASTIMQLEIAPAEETGYTNTVNALRVAARELNSERHNPNARRVLVLLTDGLPTAPGEKDIIAEAEALAAELNDTGLEIYAIGLGENVDESFIRNIATSDATTYFAPSGADLAAIYSEITQSLCESGPTKIDVIAKTKTNFAPLR